MTIRVPMPPTKTAGTASINAAIVPALNSPISLDAPLNKELTALIQPRISSGAMICINVEGILTLTLSVAPRMSVASRDTHRIFDRLRVKYKIHIFETQTIRYR